MQYLALRGLGAVLDVGKQFRLDPDALMRDALAVGLSFAEPACDELSGLRLETDRSGHDPQPVAAWLK